MTNTLPMPTTLLLILAAVLLLLSHSNVSALAAAAKKGRVAAARGFGAAPPTWQEVAASYKTRKPRNALTEPCPCDSGESYEDCCAPYHLQEKWPESPSKVLQTRYSAFIYRLPEYIMETTHPVCQDWRKDKMAWVKDLNKNGMFDNYDFVSLEAQEEDTTSGDEGFVEFTVKMKGHDGSAFEGDERVIKERSQFLKNDKGKWTYASGEISVVV